MSRGSLILLNMLLQFFQSLEPQLMQGLLVQSFYWDHLINACVHVKVRCVLMKLKVTALETSSRYKRVRTCLRCSLVILLTSLHIILPK